MPRCVAAHRQATWTIAAVSLQPVRVRRSVWHPEAEAELRDAAIYYAEHASLAVAEAFLAEFERVRDLLAENPRRGPHGDFGLRLYHFDRFPYTVIYEPDERLGPQIYAIAHQHREPGYWLSRT